MKFRKKPVVIEAFQWTGDNVREMAVWAAHAAHEHRRGKPGFAQEQSLPIDLVSLGHGQFRCEIITLEGTMNVSSSDWIICGVNGEFYPCKPDIFAMTYEAETP